MTKATLIGFFTWFFAALIFSSNYHEDLSSQPQDDSNETRKCYETRIWGLLVECCCADEPCKIVMRGECH